MQIIGEDAPKMVLQGVIIFFFTFHDTFLSLLLIPPYLA
jgi:hypothetical protein